MNSTQFQHVQFDDKDDYLWNVFLKILILQPVRMTLMSVGRKRNSLVSLWQELRAAHIQLILWRQDKFTERRLITRAFELFECFPCKELKMVKKEIYINPWDAISRTVKQNNLPIWLALWSALQSDCRQFPTPLLLQTSDTQCMASTEHAFK